MIEIALVNCGYFVLIDEIDLDLIGTQRWYLYDYKRTLYAQNSQGIKMHCLIIPDKAGFVRHHKNGNGLDNRRENLEYRTTLENLQDKVIYSSNKTGVIGVKTRPNYTGKFPFQAQITVNKRRIHLGVFESLDAAKRARKLAELKYR